MDYKNTLNLPKTDFPMKADLPKKEPLILERWDKEGLYQLILKKSAGRPKYILHDGPPYANGDIHIGHALNKTLKDIVVKFKTLRGFSSAYVPGWDCHGLPVEHQLFKELGMNKHQISQVDFRKQAYDYAMRFVNIQKGQFRRLGVFGDWDNPYLTLDKQYEQTIVVSFGELFKKGYIYRGLKPVNWCYVCETALAEAEVEYEDHVSPSIYVKFEILGLQGILKEIASKGKKVYAIVWTTTPWTLIANVAIAVAPNFKYSLLEVGNEAWLIQEDLAAAVMERLGIKDYKVIGNILGQYLENIPYRDIFEPPRRADLRFVLAKYVSKEEGTGCVHTAPGHGQEDYLTGGKYHLETVMPVNGKGEFYLDISGEFKGQHVFAANPNIINKLKKQGSLVFSGEVTHTYPHCWRCKTPIVFRATEQWFMDIDKLDLRKKLLDAVAKDISWIPAAGRERITAMIELRPDWCLSRQRYWGVPIPALGCNKCGRQFLNEAVIDNFARFIAQENSGCWFERNIQDFLPNDIQCPHCDYKGKDFIKGSDILDVWFDSGVSHQAVLKKRQELDFPCALYLEGSDQHRGWFQSSLIPSMAIDHKPPFKSVLTHGFVVDGEGRKMSKSLGNVISPQDIIKDYGADILRLWVASSDYNEDIRISAEILSRLSEAYRKIRNTVRFILSNLYDFTPDINKVEYEQLKRIDKWILFKSQSLLRYVDSAYENFDFYKVYKAIYDFCNEELSMYYLDMVKGRLYTYASDSVERCSVQTAIYEILNILVRIATPILVFTCEEIYQHMPKGKDNALTSVHLLEWPGHNPTFAQDDLQRVEKDIASQLKAIIELIPDIAKALEEKRGAGVIGSSFDAKIILLTKDEFRYKYLESIQSDLAEIFKVSQVQIHKKDKLDAGMVSQKYPELAIIVEKANGEKCTRCWNYSVTLGKDQSHPLICDRCLTAL
jgi:isoleucyl-tRNA synthetase